MAATYVILTGAKNNCGDFLIRTRLLELLARERSDRAVLELNRWEPISDEHLELVNSAKAVILAGGPALKRDLYPGVYPLREDLGSIAVPIVPLGVGWNHALGRWVDAQRFTFSPSSAGLLQRIGTNGIGASVRDYHSGLILRRHGVQHVVVTGCPSLFVPSRIGVPPSFPAYPQRVTYTPCVAADGAAAIVEQQRALIMRLARDFAELTVAFHHGITPEQLLRVYRDPSRLMHPQQDLIKWLTAQGLRYADLSGSADRMLEHYSSCDLHVGYRVHAHILMCSLSRPSVLLAEDARGRSLHDLIGGLVFDSFSAETRRRLLGREVMEKRWSLPVEAVIENIRVELEGGCPRSRLTRAAIDQHYEAMKAFLARLP